ncbi:BatA domain-containing protein, partial [Akkermansiaceae bacterium]|nr:BatA domain-containing protein [Akkermansiaceae bacterium]
MNFLVPALLWGLLAAAIPVIIHLLNRRRFRTVKWAATTFLLKASRESRGKKRLKHILILACRALAIAALIFAVARPLVGSFLGWGSGSVETVVLVLDRSPSMEIRGADGQPSQREAVLERIATSLKSMGEPRLVLIDSATREMQDVASPEVLPELSSTQSTDTQADIPGLLITAI